MGTIKEIKALGVGFVGFYEGKREAYQADSYVDKLYFASDTGELLFNSKSYSVIVDDLLTSDSTTHALSANQGKQLKSLIDNINSSVSEISLFALANTAGYTGTEEELINKLNTAYLPLTGGTLSGSLTLSSGDIYLSPSFSLKDSTGGNLIGVLSNDIVTINIGNTNSSTILYTKETLSRNSGSASYEILDRGNFIADTDYVSPSNLGSQLLNYLPLVGGMMVGSIDLGGQNIRNNALDLVKLEPEKNNLSFISPNSRGTSNNYSFLLSSGEEIGEVYVKLNDGSQYKMYHAYNFKADTDYITPLYFTTQIANYLPLSGGTLTGNVNLSYTSNSDAASITVLDTTASKSYNVVSYSGTLNIADVARPTIISSQVALRRETGYSKYKIYDENSFVADEDYVTPSKLTTDLSNYLLLTGGEITGDVKVPGIQTNNIYYTTDTGDKSDAWLSIDDTTTKIGLPTHSTNIIGESVTANGNVIYTTANLTDQVVNNKLLTGLTTAESVQEIVATDSIVGAFGKLKYHLSQIYTKEEVDSLLSGILKYKGTKQTYDELPQTGNKIGDVWTVVNSNNTYPDSSEFVWNGTVWEYLGSIFQLTKESVEAVLTGNITSHTHSYLPLTGGDVTGAVTVAEGVETSVLHVTEGGAIFFTDENSNMSTLQVLASNPENKKLIYTPTSGGQSGVILHSLNFVAGTDYVTPSELTTSLGNYLPLTGGRLSGELTSSSSIKGTGYLGVAATAFPQIQFQNTGSANYTSLLFTNILSGNVKSLIFRPDSTESSVDAVIYHSQNFVSGVNYVAPSTLDNYVDLTSTQIISGYKVFPGVPMFGQKSSTTFNTTGIISDSNDPSILCFRLGSGDGNSIWRLQQEANETVLLGIQGRKAMKITSNASNINITADNFIGHLTGNADSATMATSLDPTKTYTAVNFSTSDIRLKTNITSIPEETITRALQAISLNKSFNYKASRVKGYGPIAQELEELMPELVYTNEDDIKGVNNIALLHLQIQGLLKKVEKLETLVHIK